MPVTSVCDLWQGCKCHSSGRGAKRLPRDGSVSGVLFSVWTDSTTAFGDMCCFMLKPRNNSLLQKEDLQRTRKEEKRAVSSIFCYINLVVQEKLCVICLTFLIVMVTSFSFLSFAALVSASFTRSHVILQACLR